MARSSKIVPDANGPLPGCDCQDCRRRTRAAVVPTPPPVPAPNINVRAGFDVGCHEVVIERNGTVTVVNEDGEEVHTTTLQRLADQLSAATKAAGAAMPTVEGW